MVWEKRREYVEVTDYYKIISNSTEELSYRIRSSELCCTENKLRLQIIRSSIVYLGLWEMLVKHEEIINSWFDEKGEVK